MTGTIERPIYRKVEEENSSVTQTFMIVCDEGWREMIICNGLYDWIADWLIEQLQGQPLPVPHVGVIA